jgi:hypothetical protein
LHLVDALQHQDVMQGFQGQRLQINRAGLVQSGLVVGGM